MARKKKTDDKKLMIEAPAFDQPITETIEKNYMPYVMTVIISRAIPEIDGFKPSHRKLLYTMYKMGLMSGPRAKSSKIVGQTMTLHPHGDASIYETMVRLTRGNEALLHPFVDSKGSFGKQYSRDMDYAAARYTEAKLDPFCNELFSGIDKDAVDFVPNFDNTTTEPVLLPTTFPNILISPNMGIAVGLASNICSFNLAEICDGTIALLRNPNTSTEKLMSIIKAPDFSGGGYLIYDKEQMRAIFETGKGSFKLRARYKYDKDNNCIEILQIPYSTSIEVIMKKISDLMREGKLKDITEIRDEIGLTGFKLAIDIKRGTDPDALMKKLYKLTTLEDDFKCNFNVLIGQSPMQLGVSDILKHWIDFRLGCVRRELNFTLGKKKDKLHLLLGLGKILLDIDKAIKIVRETAKEAEVVPRLMEGFRIDEIQAEYIAEIKLRHLNREYIINRIKEIETLKGEIAELEELLGDELKLRAYVAKQLADIKKKYGIPRKTQLLYTEDLENEPEVDETENYNVRVVFTKGGYFKKITFQSLRGNDEQKLKEGDEIVYTEDTENVKEIMVFTDKCRVYKGRIADFESTKASALGDYLPTKLNFDADEKAIMTNVIPEDVTGHNIIFIFENGKGVRVPVSSYETKATRRRLTGAYSASSPIVAAIYETEPVDIYIENDAGQAICIKSALIPEKATRTAGGVTLFTLKKDRKVTLAASGMSMEKYPHASCKKIKIPATGVNVSAKK
ncbi:MAG: topoisomerase IV [Ruminococcaceae bacterium]|nr:topoisomerase IV [Oscillospiraceae bacterium]